MKVRFIHTYMHPHSVRPFCPSVRPSAASRSIDRSIDARVWFFERTCEPAGGADEGVTRARVVTDTDSSTSRGIPDGVDTHAERVRRGGSLVVIPLPTAPFCSKSAPVRMDLRGDASKGSSVGATSRRRRSERRAMMRRGRKDGLRCALATNERTNELTRF